MLRRVDQLSGRYREVIALRYIADLGYVETDRELDLNPKPVSSRLRTPLDALAVSTRRLLGPERCVPAAV